MKNQESQYKKALEAVAKTGVASTSHFQRVLGVGYKTAADLLDLLEKDGVVGPQNGARAREIHMERVEAILGSDVVAACVCQPKDDLAALNDKVNMLASTVTETAYKLIEEAANSGADLYRALIGKFGEPVRVMFKIERRQSEEVVVGGELQFKGTDVLVGLVVGDDAVKVNGKECGGSSWLFGDCDKQLSDAVVGMFVKLYERKQGGE